MICLFLSTTNPLQVNKRKRACGWFQRLLTRGTRRTLATELLWLSRKDLCVALATVRFLTTRLVGYLKIVSATEQCHLSFSTLKLFQSLRFSTMQMSMKSSSVHASRALRPRSVLVFNAPENNNTNITVEPTTYKAEELNPSALVKQKPA